MNKQAKQQQKGVMGAGGGAAILALASFVSYLLGAIRDPFFANIFGAGMEADAYNTAFLIPDFLLNLMIMGALSGVLMPKLVNIKAESESRAVKLFADFFGIMNLLIIVMSVVIFAIAPWLLTTIFSIEDPVELALTAKLTRIILVQTILFALSHTINTALLAEKRFLAVAFAPVFYNAGILLGIVFALKSGSIEAVAWGTVFGAFMHFFIRFLALRTTPFRFILSVDWHNPNFWQVIALSIPKTIALVAFQGMLVGYRVLSEVHLADGKFSIFQYARNIQSFSVSLFGIALATAVFPFLAGFHSRGEREHFVFRLEKSARQILFLAFPAALGIVILNQQIVDVILGHGNFTAQDGVFTSMVLLYMAFSIPFESLMHLFSRAFLAQGNTWIVMLGQLLFFAVTVGGSALTIGDLGVLSFGVFFTLGAFLQVALLIIWFHFRVDRLPIGYFWQKFSRTFFLSILMALVVLLIIQLSQGLKEYIALALAIIGGGAVYLGGAFLLRMPEVERAVKFLTTPGK